MVRNFLFALALILVPAALLTAQDSSSQDSNSSSDQPRLSQPKRLPDQAKLAASEGEKLLFKDHDPKAATESFKRSVKLDPWYGHGYMMLGVTYMQLQQWGDAQWAFEEAAKVEPENAQAFLGVGSALNEQRDYSGARKALEHSLELKPDSAEAHYELARTLSSQGKWQAAEPHVRRAISINKDYPGPHVLMGNIYLGQEDAPAALAEFEEYLRLDPDGDLASQVKQIVAQIKDAMLQK